MAHSQYPYGYRILGGCQNDRRLIDWQDAFRGYADCHELADVNREAYLSAFTFGEEFRRHLADTDSTRGYQGACWSPWLWWDIDREDAIALATHDARRLTASIVDHYRLDESALLIFFSGSKGYHVGLPTSVFSPEPSAMYHRASKHFAVAIADRADVQIDNGVYDRVRAFRAPNSRHPKTGLHKRRLDFNELMHLKPDAILSAATNPEPFDIPEPPPPVDTATAEWLEAVAHVEREEQSRQERVAANGYKPTLNRRTIEFIRDGANVGDRHRLLYSAARNLGECGCSVELASALLLESSLDSGLPPKDVRRQIECGIRDTSKGHTA
jgi:hypothetical protein